MFFKSVDDKYTEILQQMHDKYVSLGEKMKNVTVIMQNTKTMSVLVSSVLQYADNIFML